MAGLTVRNLNKAFKTTRVLRDVSLSIADGKFVVLVGPSGCGKSTPLRLIAGLDDATGGEILVGDRCINDVPPRDRDIAMVFQNYALYPHMRVADNLGFCLKLRGVPRHEIAKRVANVADILDLTPLLDRLPRQLSGGQRQRGAMGRAIVRDSQVFLFDEPLSNLDAALRVRMRNEIKALHQRLGNTMIYVTHDQVEALTMADRIVVMRDGTVEQIGTPLELYDRPADAFVAGFIGSPAMNFLKGRVVRRDGPAFRTGDGVVLPLLAAPAAAEGRTVLYGIRPEHLSVAENGMPATVTIIASTGAETQFVARLGTQEIIGVVRDRDAVRPGETVFLQPNAASAHLFDAESGRRLN
jgi:multiple sugar transport system ATP-binding protein